MDAVVQLIGDFAELFAGLEFLTQVLLVAFFGGHYMFFLGRRLLGVTKTDLIEFESALASAESDLSASIAEAQEDIGELRAKIAELPVGKADD